MMIFAVFTGCLPIRLGVPLLLNMDILKNHLMIILMMKLTVIMVFPSVEYAETSRLRILIPSRIFRALCIITTMNISGIQ